MRLDGLLRLNGLLAAASTALFLPAADAQEATPPRTVAALLAAHDRALVRELQAYIGDNPRASDIEQAHLSLFETVIKNDWFGEAEATAATYLAEWPNGAVRPLAQVVATMARARAGDFPAAIARFEDLLNGLDGSEQAEFAASLADDLAGAAAAAGEVAAARRAYQSLRVRFAAVDPGLAERVGNELDRLDLAGKVPALPVVKDIAGRDLDLGALRGRFVLIDFWATWCAPCVADLPALRALQESRSADGLVIVSVSLDEAASAVSDFVKARGIPWRQVHNATSGGDLVAAFRVGRIPSRVLLAPDGAVLRLDPRLADVPALIDRAPPRAD
jgi:thiol-disulfide isomerase/thioredoxin